MPTSAVLFAYLAPPSYFAQFKGGVGEKNVAKNHLAGSASAVVVAGGPSTADS